MKRKEKDTMKCKEKNTKKCKEKNTMKSKEKNRSKNTMKSKVKWLNGKQTLNDASIIKKNIPTVPVDSQTKLPHLNVTAEFVWDDDKCDPKVNKCDSSTDDSADENDGADQKTKRQKILGNSYMTESQLREAELHLLDSSRQPESVDEFDRLVLASPDSSIIWIKYMAYHLQATEIDKARAVAERALKTICFREEQERLNVWIALLNLENSYGTKESLTEKFRNALQFNDDLKVFNHYVCILEKSGKLEDAEHYYNEMTKRFRGNKDVWLSYGHFLMRNNQRTSAMILLERCLKTLPKREHVSVISKFAQYEFKFGDAQRGRSMFETIVKTYPKRLDAWSFYIDMVWRVAGDVNETRQLFDRVVSMTLPARKMKPFFSRYLQFERRHGTSSTQSNVKRKAEKYIRNHSLEWDLDG